ncbi:hypothetical protein K443DRAFT_254259 [Laccaria amethystina LaAM-08-1]|uniref:Unplaced genomic scaffold K443scaffold_161, whole genome shotgun sequence n=1 Tax=Laccaria amethystina LaAM-08-1 TaxID=1095629 RepID=A0A0C9XI73_9AGAR|nr:hypothetical protein K443DRAFT_254259 [Laccaria amethystina LaAM-08-1]
MGKTFLRLNGGDLEGFELPNNPPHLLCASSVLRQIVLRGRICGFESRHNFPVHSPQEDDFSSNSRRNTSFGSTSDGNGTAKGMILITSLERSSNSEDYNDDHNDEGGGRRWSSPDKSQPNSTPYSPTNNQRHSPSYSHKTQRTLPSWGTVRDLFSFFAPSPGLVLVLVLMRGKSRAHGQKEKKRSNFPTKLVSCRTRPCLRLYIPALARSLHLYLRGHHLFLHGPSVRSSSN